MGKKKKLNELGRQKVCRQHVKLYSDILQAWIKKEPLIALGLPPGGGPEFLRLQEEKIHQKDIVEDLLNQKHCSS